MRKHKKLLGLVLLSMILLIVLVSAEDVDDCMNLNISNIVYVQTENIIPTISPCINITADNITFDGNGNWIKNSALNGKAIYSNSTNTTILNTNITLENTYGYGIYLNNSNNSHITNNWIKSTGNGLSILGSTNVNINNNTILLGWVGMDLSTSAFNNLYNNTVYGTASDGIILEKNSNNNTFNLVTSYACGGSGFVIDVTVPRSTNNTFINSNASYNTMDGFTLNSAPANTTFINNTASNNGRYGLYLIGSGNLVINNTFNSNANAIAVQGISNSSFINNTLLNCLATGSSSGCFLASGMTNVNFSGGIINNSAGNGIGLAGAVSNNNFSDFLIGYSTLNDTYLSGTAGSINNIFLNVTYLLSKEYVNIDSQLIRKWYYRAYVNDTYGNPLQDAYINATNVSGVSVYNSTTSSLGYSTNFNITDYFNNGTRYYSSNYTLNASKLGYTSDSHQINSSFGNNLIDFFTLIPPAASASGGPNQVNNVQPIEPIPVTQLTPVPINQNTITGQIQYWIEWAGSKLYPSNKVTGVLILFILLIILLLWYMNRRR